MTNKHVFVFCLLSLVGIVSSSMGLRDVGSILVNDQVTSVSFSDSGDEVLITSRTSAYEYGRSASGDFSLKKESLLARGESEVRVLPNGYVAIIADATGELVTSSNLTFGERELSNPKHSVDFEGMLPTSLAVTKGHQILVGFENGNLSIFTADSAGALKLVQTVTTSHQTISKIATAGETLVTCGYENFVEVYEISASKGKISQVQTIEIDATTTMSICLGLDLTTSAKHFTVSKQSDQVYVMEREKGKKYKIIAKFRPREEEHSTNVKLTDDGKHLLVIQESHSIGLWSSESRFEEPIDFKEGRYLLTADWDEKHKQFAVAHDTGVKLYALGDVIGLTKPNLKPGTNGKKGN